MLRIKALALIACTVLIITPAYAFDDVNLFVPNSQKVGQARMTYMFWDIYDATLYAPQGTWETEKPFALKLSYLRALDGKKIADRSIKEMRGQGFTDEIKLAAWHTQMRQIFPDVDNGVSITGINTKSGETIFYKNNTEIGRIKDPAFSIAFFNIWLSDKTSEPNLRRKLLGSI